MIFVFKKEQQKNCFELDTSEIHTLSDRVFLNSSEIHAISVLRNKNPKTLIAEILGKRKVIFICVHFDFTVLEYNFIFVCFVLFL